MDLLKEQFQPYLFILEKYLAIFGTVIYFIFALIIVRQVISMSKHIQDKFNYVLIIFSWVHLAFSALLILITILIL